MLCDEHPKSPSWEYVPRLISDKNKTRFVAWRCPRRYAGHCDRSRRVWKRFPGRWDHGDLTYDQADPEVSTGQLSGRRLHRQPITIGLLGKQRRASSPLQRSALVVALRLLILQAVTDFTIEPLERLRAEINAENLRFASQSLCVLPMRADQVWRYPRQFRMVIVGHLRNIGCLLIRRALGTADKPTATAIIEHNATSSNQVAQLE